MSKVCLYCRKIKKPELLSVSNGWVVCADQPCLTACAVELCRAIESILEHTYRFIRENEQLDCCDCLNDIEKQFRLPRSLTQMICSFLFETDSSKWIGRSRKRKLEMCDELGRLGKKPHVAACFEAVVVG